MDELTLLRRLDPDARIPSRRVANDAFALLEQRMAAAEHASQSHLVSRRRRSVRVRWAVLATAGAASLVAALVLTDTIGVADLRPGATAQAAELLNRAADTTIRSVDPTLRPGQYQQVIFRSVHQVDGGNQDIQGVYSIHEDRTTWIPADPREEWFQVRYPSHSAGQYWTKDAKKLAEYDDRLADEQKPQLLHGDAGDFFGGGSDPRSTPEGVNALPRDPRALLNHIYRVTLGAGNSPDSEALVFITDTLNTGVATAPTRAALYRAAALIPGVTLTTHSATLDGTTGIAIGRTEPKYGIRQELVIDPDSGQLIGEREVATRDLPDGTGNAGDVLSSSSVTTTTVNSVPKKYRS